MRTVKWGLVAVVLSIIMLADQKARAQQIPPHNPGAICQTPRFWCWAQPPGPPGGACQCQSPAGPVKGTLI